MIRVGLVQRMMSCVGLFGHFKFVPSDNCEHCHIYFQASFCLLEGGILKRVVEVDAVFLLKRYL